MSQATAVRSFSLTELLSSVRRCLEHSFPDRYWVRAEVSDLRRAGAQGHGYLELLEKGEQGDVVAKARATIWSSTYTQIEQRCERSGVGKLVSGMSILALVGIAFHPLYGLSLNIIDIDPNYSLGEIARLRQETIQRLKHNGLFQMNKELELPRPLQRIAIISSPTAAGYGDFMRQLHANSYGVVLYTALFTAQMQGSDTTPSVIAALGRIAAVEEHFDAVVIIRGGGAVSELRAFDDYALCEAAAQFPLPIISGIGHERDVSVLDLVAHTSLKTPTAVAAFLVDGLANELATLLEQLRRLPALLQALSMGRSNWLHAQVSRLPLLVRSRFEQAERKLLTQRSQITLAARHYLQQSDHRLDLVLRRLPVASVYALRLHQQQLRERLAPLPLYIAHLRERWEAILLRQEQAVRLAHPDQILRRGFSLVSVEGRIVTRSSQLPAGAEIVVRFADGAVDAVTKDKP